MLLRSEHNIDLKIATTKFEFIQKGNNKTMFPDLTLH